MPTISHLRNINEILKRQLSLINQLFVHSKIQKKCGYLSISNQYARMAIINGKNAETLIEVLVDHGQIPQMKNYDLLNSSLEIDNQYTFDLQMTLGITEIIHITLSQVGDENELSLKKPLWSVLNQLEIQIDWLENQRSLVQNIGIETYIEGLLKDKPAEFTPPLQS